MWQYMLQELCKWGLKVWWLANLKFKFVSNFEVYCRKNSMVEEEIQQLGGHGKA